MIGLIIDDAKIEFYSRLVAADGIQERTASRLKEMAAIGMMELGNASFGVPNVMDGMYVEGVWRMDDQQFADYLKWVKELILEKEPAIEKARREVFSLLRAQKEIGADVLSGIYEYRFDRLLVKVTRTMWENFCIYYSTGNIGSSSYRFYTTEYELFGTNRRCEAEGHAVDSDDMHWTVNCPACNKEYEFTGYL